MLEGGGGDGHCIIIAAVKCEFVGRWRYICMYGVR